MPEMNTDRDPVEILADEYTARQRRGERPTIEEYAARYPDLADDIRVLFPTIAALEKLKVRQQRTPDGRVTLAGYQLERLGDFRVIREIGRGGMGIVYEAEQESLGRRVAVKVLPKQALLDPKHLQRFQREARTAAGLHHTNIVPVFGVGQHEGFYYYVMQYIPGVGLDRVLARLEQTPAVAPEAGLSPVVQELLSEPAPPPLATAPAYGTVTPAPAGGLGAALRLTRPLRGQVTQADGAAPLGPAPSPLSARALPNSRHASHWGGIARLGLQIADALHYAHSHGTLHRDIKPANLIIDTQGVVWVADFGLAKALEEDAVSRSGDIVGTLAYMAPEQLRGQADRRSDIYSLGLTLYELLTLRPAFHDADRARLLQRIAHEDPIRPRQIRPEIPPELETIVLKATAREPERRYETAGELAEDLQCFLEDRPIRARRSTPPERLWRWCRRNRAVASLTALAATLLLIVALVASFGYARTSRALAGEKAQRQRAETATDLAVKVLDRLYERFTPDDAESAADRNSRAGDGEQPATPILSEGAAAVLEDMLAFYDRLAEQGGSDAAYREKVALANRRVGDIRQHLGQLEPAAAAYQRALDIYEQLDASAAEKAHVAECARVSNQLGSVYRQSRKYSEGREAHQRALQLLEAAAQTPPASPGFQYELARTWYLLARCELADRPPRALANGEAGDERLPYEGYYEDTTQKPRPGGPDFAPGRPGDPPRPFGPHAKPPWGKKPVDDDGPPWDPPGFGPPPGDPAKEVETAKPARPEAADRTAKPDPQDSAKPDDCLQKAIDVLTKMDDAAAAPEQRLLLARCYRELAVGSLPIDAYRAVEAAARADRILQRLVAAHPDNLAYGREVQRIHSFLVLNLPWLAENEYERIGAALEQARRTAANGQEANPASFERAATRAHVQHLLGIIEDRLDRPVASEKSVRQAIAWQSELVQRQSTDPVASFWLAKFQFTLAEQLLDRGRPEEASRLLEDSARMLEQRLQSDPKLTFVHGNLYWLYRALADALSATGAHQAAIEADRQAADHRQYLPPTLLSPPTARPAHPPRHPPQEKPRPPRKEPPLR